MTFLSLLSLSLLILGHSLGERQGLLLAFLIAVSTNTFVYIYGSDRLLGLFAHRELQGQDPWGILHMTRDLAKRAGIPAPRIYMVLFPTPTALSVGRSWSNAKIILSENLPSRLTHDELRAVIALELAKIKRLDTLSFGVGSSFATILFFIARVFDTILQPIAKLLRKESIFAQILISPIAALFVRGAARSSQYLEADKMAAQLTGEPLIMAKALSKLKSYATTQPLPIPTDSAHLFIVNPLSPSRLNRYFVAQPSLEERVRNLVGQYPI